MEDRIQPMVENYQKEHRTKMTWHSVIRVLAYIVVFCTVYALILPAITWDRTLVCEKTEHVHTDECYEMVADFSDCEPICGLTEHHHTDECLSDTPTLICENQEEGHEHTRQCYEVAYICGETEHTHAEDCFPEEALTERVPVCGLEEHIHDDSCFDAPPAYDEGYYCGKISHTHNDYCYFPNGNSRCTVPEHEHTLLCKSNPNADLENSDDWEATFAGVVRSGNAKEDILAIAKTQIGYSESKANYTVVDNDVIKGYTRYGAWYGAPYSDWCAMFCSFCIHYAGVEDFPLSGSCGQWIETLQQQERYQKAGEYDPEPGDLIFFDMDSDGKAEHVGFVYEKVTEETPNVIRTIEGNRFTSVAVYEFEEDDKTILSYGVLPTKVMVSEVQVTISAEEEEDTVVLTAAVEGADEEDYRWQWQYSTDGENWNDIENANELVYTFIKDGENNRWYYRVVGERAEENTAETQEEPKEPAPERPLLKAVRGTLMAASPMAANAEPEETEEKNEPDENEVKSEEAKLPETVVSGPFKLLAAVSGGYWEQMNAIDDINAQYMIVYNNNAFGVADSAAAKQSVTFTAVNNHPGYYTAGTIDDAYLWKFASLGTSTAIQNVGTSQYLRLSNNTWISTSSANETLSFSGNTVKISQRSNNTTYYLCYNSGAFTRSSTDDRNGMTIYKYVKTLPVSPSGNVGYYKIAESISANKEYLIVSAEGNYALAYANGSISSTPLEIHPIKGNDGILEVSGASDNNLWNFSGGRNRTVEWNGSGRYLTVSDNALGTGSTGTSFTVNKASVTDTWTIANNSNYLHVISSDYIFGGDTDGTSYGRNFLLLEPTNEPTVPDDPIEHGSGSEEETVPTAPDYPDYVTPSGKKDEVVTSVGDVAGKAYSDPATSNIETKFDGDGNKADDGKVLADKSVIYKGDDYGAFKNYADNVFSVTLSALGQEYALTETDEIVTPIDVVFILDVSGSMSNNTPDGTTRREAMVNAVNASMTQIFEEHEENRVGIVLFSSGSWDLLEIDHYDAGNTEGKYIELNSSGDVRSVSGLLDEDGNSVTRRTDSTQQQGTYTQSGIARGAAMFDRITDTTYSKQLGSGESARTYTVQRQPVIILLSDGDPTHCNSDYGNVLLGPNYGSGVYTNAQNNRGIQGYYTILSANYYKKEVGIHYDKMAKFFTVGMGINETDLEDFSEKSATDDHYKRAVLNPTANNIRDLTNTDAKNYETTSHQLRDLLANRVTDQYLSVASSNTYSDVLGRTNVNVPVVSNPYSSYSYADKAYFGDIKKEDLDDIFADIIEGSLKVKNYGFILKKRSSVEIEDPIGDGMLIQGDPILNYGGRNYTHTSKSTSGNVTTYTYNYTYKATDGSGYTANLSEIKVTVTKDPTTKKQVVRMVVPDDVLPAYTPCTSTKANWYYEALPARLIYQVGLSDESKAALAELPLGETKTFYTNDYDPDNPNIGAKATEKPADDNPYYKEDGSYKDTSVNKTDNTSDTKSTSYVLTHSTVTYEGEQTEQITHAFGNNGKLVFEGNKVGTLDLTVEKVDAYDNVITISETTFELYEDEGLTEKVGTYTTTHGVLTIEDLEAEKSYWIRETVAPKGFVPMTDARKFTIHNDGSVTTPEGDTYLAFYNSALTVRNYPGGKLPFTGGTGRTFLYATGILVLTGTLLVVRVLRRRERRATL